MKKNCCTMVVVLLLMMVFSSALDTGKVYGKEKEYPYIQSNDPEKIMRVGSTFQINAKATLNEKKLKGIYYQSGDKSIAKVDQNGKVTALKAGVARIYVKIKGYPDCRNLIIFNIYNRFIKINAPKKYIAGNTYQLKASEKNVKWEVYNFEGTDARASIDSNSGRLKIRNGGKLYAFCTSKDGKGIGAVYIYAKGIKINKEVIKCGTIEINEDEHIVNVDELNASGKLPKKIKLSYTNGNKKGFVETKVTWGGYISDYNEYEEAGTYKLDGSFDIPEGYTISDRTYENMHVEINIDVKVKQTDTRMKIVSVDNLEPITLSKDKHITKAWDVVDKLLNNTKLKCTLEDGSIVSLPVSGIGYQGSGENCSFVGTYNYVLIPKRTAGYLIEDDIEAKFKLKVTKKQTYVSVSSINDIGGYAITVQYATQKALGK